MGDIPSTDFDGHFTLKWLGFAVGFAIALGVCISLVYGIDYLIRCNEARRLRRRDRPEEHGIRSDVATVDSTFSQRV